MRLVVGNDSAPFLPLFFGFQVNNTVGHVEIGEEAPFVLSAEVGWESALYDLRNGLIGIVVGKALMIACDQASAEANSRAENAEVL